MSKVGEKKFKTTKSVWLLHVLAVVFSYGCQPTQAQVKPSIDTSILGKWPLVKNPAICNNGKYALYTINNVPADKFTTVIQSTNDNWKKEFIGSSDAVFSDDSKSVILKVGEDSICMLKLGTNEITYISEISSFQLSKQCDEQLLLYKLSNPTKELKLLNLKTGVEQTFDGVVEYLLGNNGTTLILKTQSNKDTSITQSLSLVNLLENNRKVIWEGVNGSNLVLDAVGKQVAFVVDEIKNGPTERSIWYYKMGMDKAELLSDKRSTEVFDNLELDGISAFNKNGEKLFISLKEKKLPKPGPNVIKVDVWNYCDTILQSAQQQSISPRSYWAFIRLDGEYSIIRLEGQNEKIVAAYSSPTYDDIFVMSKSSDVPFSNLEKNWNAGIGILPSYILFCTNGVRKELPIFADFLNFSPCGQYLIGHDADRINILSYEISTGLLRNITKSLQIPVGDGGFDLPSRIKNRGLRILNWLSNDQALLIKDSYDIWLIDPRGLKAPVNLTNGFGRKNKIAFHLTELYNSKIINENEESIIGAIDQTNFNSGFFKICIGKSEDPELLTIGKNFYAAEQFAEISQVKARDCGVYIIRRENSSQSPNFYLTRDFRTFSQLSRVFPETNYNWLVSELISFKALDGRTVKAILYKPENFDLTNKYPVIIHYYERMSQDLHKYTIPNEPYDNLDISWFVSHGYIVVTPDVHYVIGKPGASACNSIIAIRDYLSGLTWVDGKHMGIQGHSFGGYETNYVITQTNLFAAAISSSAASNLISDYGSLETTGFGFSHQYAYEYDQYRIGASLWERPDLYIKNSPIFYADRINTPLLMVANKKDVRVAVTQGIELFIALRRLGKRTWMLQYDEGSHGLNYRDDKMDYLIRMTQFFDHYLKDAPAPKWMTRGIPAKMKGIDDGLELVREKDVNGKWITPGAGLLTNEEQIKVDKLMKGKKPKVIKLD